MSLLEPLLIIANSGRLLADLAHRAGYQVLVIDRFADQDTLELAFAHRLVERLTVSCLAPVVANLIQQCPVDKVILGSGFENQPESINWLATRFTLLANGAETVVNIGNPKDFFDTLNSLQINHPEISYQPPEFNTESWLVKPMYSEGGQGVRHYKGQEFAENRYLQRYQSGAAFSLLFVANGQKAVLISLHQQWVAEHQQGQDFVFSGVIQSGSERFQQYLPTLKSWIEQLTHHYTLIGLNGLDFIIDDKQCWLLEINPRPPASIALYSQNIEVLDWHIHTFDGYLPGNIKVSALPINAFQIIYASAPLTMPVDFDWPQWTCDRTRAGVNIDTEQPICSIIASANTTNDALQLLQHRTQVLYQLLNQKEAFSTCNISPALINYPNL